jgi:hypothetical protein
MPLLFLRKLIKTVLPYLRPILSLPFGMIIIYCLVNTRFFECSIVACIDFVDYV